MTSVEFWIEADYNPDTNPSPSITSVEFSKEVGLTFDFESTSIDTRSNGIRRTQRCWDFPSWRLHRAAANKEEFDEKVANSADVNAKDLNGRTALHEAAKAGTLAVVSYLLSRGAQIDAQDDHGTTPLAEALRFNHDDLARLLLAERRRREEGQEAVVQCHNGSPEYQISSTNSSSWIKFMSRIRSKMTMDRKNDAVKWLVIIVNVGLELCQAVASTEEEDGRIGGKLYRDLTAVCSWICLVVSTAEFVYEAKKNGAKWRKRRGRYCFYYPGIHTRVFGGFLLWFGLISSTIQFCLNTAALVVERAVVKFDYLALLLAICLLVAAFIHRGHKESKMAGVVKCVAHGDCGAEGVFGQGVWVFQCPQCPVEKLV